MKYDIDIFHYIGLYKKEWKRMVFLIASAIFITIILSFIEPVTYRSTVTVLSPKECGQVGALSKYLGLSSLSMGNSSDEVVFFMLKSMRMSNDINEYLDARYKRKHWWSLDTYVVTGGYALEVKGSNPEMTKDAADFAVQNLDKINQELQISTQKPMVKVLDSAMRGTPVNRNVPQKVVFSGLFIFLIYSIFIFFREYFSHLSKTIAKNNVV